MLLLADRSRGISVETEPPRPPQGKERWLFKSVFMPWQAPAALFHVRQHSSH